MSFFLTVVACWIKAAKEKQKKTRTVRKLRPGYMQQVAGLMKTLAQEDKLLWLDNLTLVPLKKTHWFLWKTLKKQLI